MTNTILTDIEHSFRKKVRNDRKVRNAYLLVHCEKRGMHLNIAEGKTGDFDAHPQQPNHLASVGKLFTATTIGMLHDQGKLSFDDPIARHLDHDLMNNLHVYKGRDYSGDIKISHLLNQTSGLNDVFYILWDKLVKNPGLLISPRDAIFYGKEHLKPVSRPGYKHFYTDTNYYLLGLIIENITGKPHHEVVQQYLFDPLGMKHAFMFRYSKPSVPSEYPMAKLYLNKTDVTTIENASRIDYAGGGVVAPLDEFLLFMKALVGHKLVKKETLDRMLADDRPIGLKSPGIHYGYSIWKFKTFPLLLPETFNCWGCVGVTGAYMFYHPKTDSYIIGSFNDMSWRGKSLQFMIFNVIKQLLKPD